MIPRLESWSTSISARRHMVVLLLVVIITSGIITIAMKFLSTVAVAVAAE